jgi:hypothetical protein
LCEDNHIQANEIWSYHAVGDQIRFTLMHRSRPATSPTRARATPARRPAAASGRHSPGSRAAKAARTSGSRNRARPQKRR